MDEITKPSDKYRLCESCHKSLLDYKSIDHFEGDSTCCKTCEAAQDRTEVIRELVDALWEQVFAIHRTESVLVEARVKKTLSTWVAGDLLTLRYALDDANYLYDCNSYQPIKTMWELAGVLKEIRALPDDFRFKKEGK